MLELFRRISLRRILLHPGRLALTLIGISLGVALFVAIQLINQATLRGFRESVESMTGKAQLSVMGPETGFNEAVVDKVAAVPGVKSAVPMVQNKAYFEGEDGSYQNLVILGLDLLKETSVRSYKTEDEQLMDDPLEFLNQPDSLIVTRKFADARGLKLESTIELGTTGGKKTFTVRGILSPEGPAKAFGGSLAIMDIDAARFTFAKEGKVDRIDLVLEEGVDEDAVLKGVTETVTPFGLYAERPEGQSQALGEMVRSYQQLLTVFSLLALVVGIFLIDNTVRTSIAERKREIASLRALGASKPTLFSLFVGEALFQGAIGSALGIFIGRLLGEALVSFVSASMSAQFVTPIDVATLKLSSSEILGGIAIGMVCTLVATLKPAYSITQINAIDALKNPSSQEGGEAPSRLSRAIGPVSIALLALLPLLARPGLEAFAPVGLVVTLAAVWWGGPFLSISLLRGVRRLFSRPGLSSRAIAPLRLSSENLLLSPSRTKSNIMALVIGILLVLSLATLSQSFRSSIVGWFERTLRSDLLVFSAGNLISTQVQPVDESLAAELAKIESVDAPLGAASVSGMRLVKVPFRGKEIQLKAFDPPHPAVGYAIFDMADGSSADQVGPRFFGSAGAGDDDGDEPVVLISDNLARNFGVKSGELIRIDTPTGPREARVLAQVTDFVSPVGVLYIRRALYREWWNDPLVTSFGVQAKAGVSIDELRKDIEEGFARKRGLITASNTELRAQAGRVIDEGFAFTRAIELCALLVGLLGLLNTMLVSILSRIRELGILRALGMSRAQQQFMILGESLFSSLAGAGVAIALGLFLSRYVLVDAVSRAIGWRIRYSFPAEALVLAVAAGVLVGLVAGVLPARRAGRITIKEALEYE